MVDFKRVPQSPDRIEDRTDDTPAEAFLTNLQVMFNPATAYRKTRSIIRGKLIEKGMIEVPGADKMLRRIDEEIRQRRAHGRKNPPEGFVVDDQGNFIPKEILTPQELKEYERMNKK